MLSATSKKKIRELRMSIDEEFHEERRKTKETFVSYQIKGKINELAIHICEVN